MIIRRYDYLSISPGEIEHKDQGDEGIGRRDRTKGSSEAHLRLMPLLGSVHLHSSDPRESIP